MPVRIRPDMNTASREEPSAKMRPVAGGSLTMSKPTKTEAELIAMAQAELKAHTDCPTGMTISMLRWGDSWELRAKADAGTASKPGYPECVAMLVQIGDHLRKQYDVKD
jgi:hypothetical protein